MAEAPKQELIIIRRYEADEEHHKGGVWKIAHADFMTAMMAFFLVMWLISVADKETKSSVANYFNPVKLAESTPDRKGLKEPQNKASDGTSTTAGEKSNADKDKAQDKGNGDDKSASAPPAPRPRFKEGALFQDPYSVLAKLAAENDPAPVRDTLGVDGSPTETGNPGINGGEAQRDPFDPLYWQVSPVPRPRTDNPGAPETTTPVPKEGSIDVRAPKPLPPGPPADKKDEKGGPKVQAPQKPAAADKAEAPEKAAPIEPLVEPAPSSATAELKSEITKAVQTSGGAASAGPKVDVKNTGEGVLISITDDINFSMFAIGSAEPQPQVVRAMEKIAKILNARSGTIIIRGHTDGRPFKSDTYDNWRLSTARGHMASYMLVRGGFPENRIERVEGYADRSLKNKADPKAAENRRIEILLREKPQ